MSFKHEDKVILVTGASSGIGEEVAIKIAKLGGKIALAARDINKLNEVKAQIIEGGGIAETFQCDLLDIDEIQQMVSKVCRHFSDSVSVLFNCAGIAVMGFVEDVPLEEYYYNLNINLFAPIALIKAVIPEMKRKKTGQIINVSSGLGKRAFPGFSPYSASKFALNGLTESLRVELIPYNIDVILISPGPVKSNFNDRVKIFGDFEDPFANVKQSSAKKTALKIVNASINRKREATFQLKTKIGCHLNYLAPGFMDFLLKKNRQ